MATVLIVDDEPDLLFLLKMVLETAGYSVVEASDGAEALEKLSERNPDMVITDLMMPVMNGRELIRQLRSNPSTASLPILLCSLHPDVAAGADAVVQKPFKPHELLRVTGALLQGAK